MKPIRVLGATAIRSDYDLLSGVYRALDKSARFEFRLLVSGAHLSPTFGNTAKLVRQDGFSILDEIETRIDSDSRRARVLSAALLLQAASTSIERYDPDVILFAGDREDALAMAIVGSYLNRATVHFFGGDHASDGHVDNPIRHAISKVVTYHFVSHPRHRQRLLRIGESPDRIYVIGSPQLDRFRQEPVICREELLERIGVSGSGEIRYAVVTHHAIMGLEQTARTELRTIIEACIANDLFVIVNSPNVDPGALGLLEVVREFSKHPMVLKLNGLERTLFVNLLRHAAVLVGNSSMGLLEAASIPLAAVNVGERQRGRLAPRNVVFASSDPDAVGDAIVRALSAEFQAGLHGIVNPYGDGHSVERAVELLGTLDYTQSVLKPEDPLDIPYSEDETDT